MTVKILETRIGQRGHFSDGLSSTADSKADTLSRDNEAPARSSSAVTAGDDALPNWAVLRELAGCEP